MIEQILDGIAHRESRFIKPPKETHAIFMDDITRTGADKENKISEHEYTIELYEYKPDLKTEKLIEERLDELGQPYVKQSRIWIESEQWYQTVYEFSLTTKEEN